MPSRMPTYFISHGGGPWPWMPEMRRSMQTLEAALADIRRQLPEPPKAILMVSAHWEEAAFTAMANPHPPMLYDYYGFPAHTYEILYAAPGSPALAERARQLIEAAGLPAATDAERGFDHGAFSPLEVMYPQAEVPVAQLSLKAGLNPAVHLALGRALAPLRDEGVLIVGSGLSYHNLRLLGPRGAEPSAAFDAWLQAAVAAAPEERNRLLNDWESAPAARIAHPREEHLIPLMVAVGAAEEEAAVCVYHETGAMGGVTASSFRFGAARATELVPA
ncbi:MAG: dioxygenase [Candidatus Protistobacter heckmanni]|nr:dioxygenase [Candidatus Protistobacter heckmanni]